MICPYRMINEVIFTPVCNCELFKINTLLEFQVISDLIVWIEIPVILFRNGIRCYFDALTCIGITYRCPSGNLGVLCSSPYIHMIPCPSFDPFAGCINLQQTGVKFICNCERFCVQPCNDKGKFEGSFVFGFTIFFNTGLAKSDCCGINFCIKVDRVCMVLHVSGLFFIALFQPFLIDQRCQFDINISATGILLQSGYMMFLILIKSYNNTSYIAGINNITFTFQKTCYFKGPLFKNVIVSRSIEIARRQSICHYRACQSALRYWKRGVPGHLFCWVWFHLLINVYLIFRSHMDWTFIIIGLVTRGNCHTAAGCFLHVYNRLVSNDITHRCSIRIGNLIFPHMIVVGRQVTIGDICAVLQNTGFVICFDSDSVPVIFHVLSRCRRDLVSDRIPANSNQSERIVFNLPVDYLVSCLCNSGLYTIFLDRVLEIDLPGVFGIMRITVFWFNRHIVLCLIGSYLPIPVFILWEIHRSIICNSDNFSVGHRWEGVFKSGAVNAACRGRGITSNHNWPCVNNKRIAKHFVFHDDIRHVVSGCGNSNGIVKDTGILVIHRGFFCIYLSRFRLIKFDIPFNFIREVDHILIAIKFSPICESEAYVGSLGQSRKVRVRLIKINFQQAICTKIKRSIYLISPAFVYNIDLQRAFLFRNNLDAFRHLICKGMIIIKLIFWALSKWKYYGILFAYFYFILSVRVLRCTGNDDIWQKIRKLGTLLHVSDLNLNHRSVFHSNGQQFFTAERHERLKYPPFQENLFRLDKAFVTELDIFNPTDELLCIILGCHAKDDRKIFQRDRACASHVICIYSSCYRICILEVNRVGVNREPACLKGYCLIKNIDLQIIFSCSQLFHINIPGIDVRCVGCGIVIIFDSIREREVDDINIRGFLCSNWLNKLIIQKLESDGNTSRFRLDFDSVFYERNIIKKRVLFIISGFGNLVESSHVSIIIIAAGISAYLSYNKLGIIRDGVCRRKVSNNLDPSIVPDVLSPDSFLFFIFPALRLGFFRSSFNLGWFCFLFRFVRSKSFFHKFFSIILLKNLLLRFIRYENFFRRFLRIILLKNFRLRFIRGRRLYRNLLDLLRFSNLGSVIVIRHAAENRRNCHSQNKTND